MNTDRTVATIQDVLVAADAVDERGETSLQYAKDVLFAIGLDRKLNLIDVEKECWQDAKETMITHAASFWRTCKFTHNEVMGLPKTVEDALCACAEIIESIEKLSFAGIAPLNEEHSLLGECMRMLAASLAHLS